MLRRIESAINRCMDMLGTLAAALLICLVVIVAYNVIGRYAFRSSSLGLQELAWHFYAAIFLLGIPFALRTGSHVRVDILYERFSDRTKALIDLLGCALFLIPTCVVIIWAGWQFTAASYGFGVLPDSVGGFFQQLVSTGIGEKSQDPGGLLNRWIIKGVIPLSFLFLLLASAAFFINRLNVFLGLARADDADHSPHDLL